MRENSKIEIADMARILGRRGGLARSRKLSSAEKSRSASRAAKTRWMRQRRASELRKKLEDDLVSTARRKTKTERLAAYSALSRDAAALASSGRKSGAR